MPKKSNKLSDELRECIESSGKSRYRISKETGIAEETLSRFMHRKGGLSMEGIDKLAECLGLFLFCGASDELLREQAREACKTLNLTKRRRARKAK